ncbi:HNH endonuclease signature motif containing protein [Myxococcus qinghaiensis]|uniref:HNH endonuclease signature motif containing protein n=1 Tax=Myxococcus qinghaiensis TaxID=2906758 RepID=UPI003898DF9A
MAKKRGEERVPQLDGSLLGQRADEALRPAAEGHPSRGDNLPRRYTQSTVSRLYGLSGNRCACPGCPNKIVASPTDYDDEAVLGNIAHIYSVSAEGPRPWPGPGVPTVKEINDIGNLVLLCAHHHREVDAQSNTFTAKELMQWRENHFARTLARRTSSVPLEWRTITVKGVRFDIVTTDAVLRAVSHPRTDIVSTKEAQRVTTSVDYFFERDRGGEFSYTLTDCRSLGYVGGRFTFLSVRSEGGVYFDFSVYSHATNEWVRLDSRVPAGLFDVEKPSRWKRGWLIAVPLWVSGMVASWVFDFHVTLIGVGSCIALGAIGPVYSFVGFVRELVLRRALSRVQWAVSIS